MTNFVYIATSLDGYIADRNNSVDWLNELPTEEGNDLGWSDFMERVDALVMGRNTIDLVLSMDVPWHYKLPVFVLSNSLQEVPAGYEDKFEILSGDVSEVVETLAKRGYDNLYVDGGQVIQQFLAKDLIDEMIITTIPVLLGAGISLFGELDKPLHFKHVSSQRHLDLIVQNTYVRNRT